MNTDSFIENLCRITELNDKGKLSDTEFADAKRIIFQSDNQGRPIEGTTSRAVQTDDTQTTPVQSNRKRKVSDPEVKAHLNETFLNYDIEIRYVQSTENNSWEKADSSDQGYILENLGFHRYNGKETLMCNENGNLVTVSSLLKKVTNLQTVRFLNHLYVRRDGLKLSLIKDLKQSGFNMN